MKMNILTQLQKLKIWRLWLLSVILSVLLTEVIVSVMDLLLLGRVTADYLLTGFVASLFVASFVVGIVVYFLDKLSRSQLLLTSIFDTTAEGIMVADGAGHITMFNQRFAELWRIPPDVLATGESDAAPAFTLDQFAEFEHFLEKVQQLNADPDALSIDTLNFKDGRTFERYSSPLYISGKLVGRLWRFHEITDIVERKYTEEKMHLLFELSPIGFILNDLDTGKFIEANAAMFEESGYSPSEFLALSYWDLTPLEYKPQELKQLESLRTVGRYGPYEKEYVRKDGTRYPVMLNGVLIRDRNGRELIWSIVQNVTERKLADQQIHQLAFYDALTNLPNRRLLIDRLQHALSIGARDGQYGAVLFLDLDDFKTLNDTKGHDIGDLLLIEVSRRLQSCLREIDTVSRLGGDEFVVVLESLSRNAEEAAAQAKAIAEKINSALSQPYQLKEYNYKTTASTGIVLFQGHRQNIEDLLKHADTAMYHAKTEGRNGIHFYDPVMQLAIEARAELAGELHLALDNEQFHLYYQMQVDSQRRPLGAEVLLRWVHPERGLVFPGQFIPLMEETGLIEPVGLWVLQTACAQLKAWQDDALTRDLTLAVNVSVKQFRQADFVAQVQRVLQESGARSSHLKLELTESTVLGNIEDIISKMHELKMLGISFSMDDFGTGYSSLQYLKRLPLDQLKIDQSFVRDITIDQNDAAIVRTIILMTEALGLHVIAEGVETEEQEIFLDLNGCRAFQGYLYSKPVPVDQFEALLLIPA